MDNLEPFLTEEIKSQILEQMMELAPDEACGFIVKEKGKYVYERVKNIAKDRTLTFRMNKAATLRATKDDNVIAIVHTHPEGPVIPSKKDMQSQIAIDKPFVIGVRNPGTGVVGVFSFGDHLLDYDLVGRPWHYGRFDCLEALRSWAWQKQSIYVPRAPRTDWWWETNRQHEVEEEDRDAYMRNIEGYGYVRFTPNMADPTHIWHPQPGDVLLMQVGSPVVNHIGVFEGDDLVFHHRYKRPSGSTPLGYLMQAQYVRGWARHKTLVTEEPIV